MAPEAKVFYVKEVSFYSVIILCTVAVLFANTDASEESLTMKSG